MSEVVPIFECGCTEVECAVCGCLFDAETEWIEETGTWEVVTFVCSSQCEDKLWEEEDDYDD